MDNLFDILVPLIFVLSIVLNGLFKPKKDQKKHKEKPPLPPFGGNDPLAELREEIRRKIEENKEGASSPQKVPGQSARTVESPKPQEPYVRKDDVFAREQRKQEQIHANQMASQNREVAERQRRMSEMQQQVREMQKRAELEKKKASRILGRKPHSTGLVPKKRSRRTQKGLVSEVIRDLKNPGSSRKAVLNAEILGTPVGLRRPSQTQSLWGS